MVNMVKNVNGWTDQSTSNKQTNKQQPTTKNCCTHLIYSFFLYVFLMWKVKCSMCIENTKLFIIESTNTNNKKSRTRYYQT